MSKSIPRLPDAELDIMLVLWRKNEPSRIGEIHAALQETRPCTKPALHSLLERLSDKGFVSIDHVEDARPYKLFTPLVSERDYRAAESRSFIDRLCRGRWQTLIASLVDSDEISRDDLDEIRALLEKSEEKEDGDE
ncbi:MAG: BlaI/MecI/CopY family transcriptional regulator [Clostridia bacterium]|nr:BlaI/MecI/CopY family transcriptional regulator [Clostridia bacterium]